MSDKIKSNEDAKNRTLDLLEKNEEWETRYEGYADSIEVNESKYREIAHKKFQVNYPLMVYSCISKVIDSGKFCYDLRFFGNSIGTVEINRKEATELKFDKKKAEALASLKDSPFKLNDELSSTKGSIILPWRKGLASRIRSFFAQEQSNILKELGLKKKQQKEAKIESEVLKILSSKDKDIHNIKPVKMGGKFFQLTTPLSASKIKEGKVSYSNSPRGGGIDILARSHKRLVVIELKDENELNEPQEVVMYQAISYATFLAKLLRSKSGKKWYKLLRESKIEKAVPKELHINVVTLMPVKDDLQEGEGSLKDISIENLNTTLHLFTLYFKEEKDEIVEFTGTFADYLKK